MRKGLIFGIFLIVLIVLTGSTQASYDYTTGRWLQRDPLGINPAGEVQNPFKPLGQYFSGTNVYEYIESNPIINSDPEGLRNILNYDSIS